VHNLSFVRQRHFYCSSEEKAVLAILDESGALSALQAADDVSHAPSFHQRQIKEVSKKELHREKRQAA